MGGRGATARAVGALVLVALVGGAGASARRAAVEPTPSGSDWNASAKSLRGAAGSRFEFVCPANGTRGQVWGTRVYTDDSSVCTAAVHAGLITLADGGIVTIEHLPGQASYTGSTANGITSADWTSYDGSFQLIGADTAGTAGARFGGGSWVATATAYRGRNGTRLEYVCPGGGRLGTVWGTNVYTDDSSVCTAAVQVGLVTATDGGRVTIEVRPGQSSYVGTTHNGVSTRDYGSWSGSFRFPAAATIPTAAPGGGGGGGGGSTTTTPTTTTTPSAPIPPPTGTPTGTVTVNGAPFTGGTVPYNATVDVTNGRLRLATTTGTLTVNGQGGITAAFRLVRGTDGGRPVVELRLAKGDFTVCPRKKASAARAAATTVRQLWGDGKGSFRTRGRYAAATVRGTNWLTADRCDGTQVKVRRGVVQVLDVPNRRTVTVRAGRSYLAKP